MKKQQESLEQDCKKKVTKNVKLLLGGGCYERESLPALYCYISLNFVK